MINFYEKVKSLFIKNNAPNQVKLVVMQYNQTLECYETRIELSFIDKTLSYRHAISEGISPAMMSVGFPKGFFDSHYVKLNDGDFIQIVAQVEKCLKHLPLIKELPFLPTGGKNQAVLRCVDMHDNWFYYLSEHASKDGSRIIHETVHEEFTILYEILSSYFQFLE